MVVRSAFKAVFGSLPGIVYLWIAFGITSSIIVIYSYLKAEWLENFGIPQSIVIPMFQTTGGGVQGLAIWIGYPAIAILLVSIYMIVRSFR